MRLLLDGKEMKELENLLSGVSKNSKGMTNIRKCVKIEDGALTIDSDTVVIILKLSNLVKNTILKIAALPVIKECIEFSKKVYSSGVVSELKSIGKEFGKSYEEIVGVEDDKPEGEFTEEGENK